MATLRYVTLTGADQKTSFARMARLSNEHSMLEWGILYDPKLAGVDNRYPSLEWIEKFADKANSKGMNIALHVCGDGVKTLLESAQVTSRDFEKPLMNIAQKFGRVQLNIRARVEQLSEYEALIVELFRTENRTRTIFQWNDYNDYFCKKVAWNFSVDITVDASAGRGILPGAWPAVHPSDVRRIGYAGGLGPDNIRAQLDVINITAADRIFTVDMESKLRDGYDRFDLDCCESVLRQAQDFIVEKRRAEGALHGGGKRKVSTLQGLWLDWWVCDAIGRGASLVVPPTDAIAAMRLLRTDGTYFRFSPTEDAHLATRLLAEERIALIPQRDGTWNAYSEETPDRKMSSKELMIAGLRAIVAKHYGDTVPKNPFGQ